jgi:aquaporin Z
MELLTRKLLGEFCGTFAMVFCGTGAIVINDVSGGAITHAGIAMTFGLIVAAMIFALGDVSGAHMNPAVTLAFALSRRFPGKQVLPYLIIQFLGALTASGTLAAMFPDHLTMGNTIPSGSLIQSFVMEFILTAILVMVIFNVSTGSKEKGMTAAIAIGGTVGLEAMFAGPVCGASMNPVRSLAPAIVSGNLETTWLYMVAPCMGALLGMVIHSLLFSKDERNPS